jgi:hypothetical protein
MSEGRPAEVEPNLGALLAEYIQAIPDASRPRFLARLERGAADRYRAWAAALPQHAETLLECAASEDQIAARADALYAVIPEDLAAIEAALPPARDTYFAVFEGRGLKEQLALQAVAERQGSQAWQGLKLKRGLSKAHLDELDALTTMELESAARLESLVDQLAD